MEKQAHSLFGFGKGPHLELIKRLMEQAGIENMSLHDHVDSVEEIWRHHHILLMPLRMEWQSLSLIEAMRFNRAAIVTDVGGTHNTRHFSGTYFCHSNGM